MVIEDFSKLTSDTKPQIQEAQRRKDRINAKTQKQTNKQTTPKYIIFKLQKINDNGNILKEARETKHLTYRGAKIRIKHDFSFKTIQARKEWDEIFKVLREKNHQPRILYLQNYPFKSEEAIKTFSDK